MSLARRLSLLFALSGIMAAVAMGGGFQLNEHGARAMAQAGAFAARASDASAMYFNPAGLAFQDMTSFYGGVTAIIPTVSFYGPLQNNTNAKTEAPAQFFSPINFYLAYPALDRVHMGISVNNPFGLGSEWPDSWVGRYITTKVSLQTFFCNYSLSYKITDDLSVGAGFSYVLGAVTLDRAVAIPLQPAGNGPEPRVHLDLSGTGAGWNVGVLYKVTPEISVGATYRSFVVMDATGTAAFNPDYAPLHLPQGGVSASLKLPATGYLGVAYKVNEDIEVEADYQYIGWSSYNQLVFHFQADGSSVVQPKNYKDTYILRIGGEYKWNDDLRLRAGYYYDHTPVDAAYVDPLLPDANRNGLNLGLGYNITKHFNVDVAYLLILFQERKAENTVINFDGTYHTRVNLIGVDLGYTF
jgi:long-chain fatty acid transport protein